MSYKTVLVHVDDGARAGVRVDAAAAIARAHGGHLLAVALTGVSRLLHQDLGAAAADPHLALHLDVLRGRAGAALDGVADRIAAAGLAGHESRIVDDEAGGGLCLLARYADLLVIGQLNPARPSSAVMRDFPAYVLLHAGRPVLIVPYAGAAAMPPRCALIAWNASREASRAVQAALPLLRRAERVDILVLDAPRRADARGADAGAAAGAELAAYLRRHGVACGLALRRAAQAPGRPGDCGETLLSHAADLGADVLVMGAYGHSRLRESVLGGATRTVLERMTLPVLMAH
ncbi:universal stress protein [Janthinobacterium sp.]|uniref:universal stress protein n=1 Tax=Janthinobacterium sp. TaxID=1871054 RepID=UPI00293D23BE|nr:universal stress protein [Janthinobacterium sp.]